MSWNACLLRAGLGTDHLDKVGDLGHVAVGQRVLLCERLGYHLWIICCACVSQKLDERLAYMLLTASVEAQRQSLLVILDVNVKHGVVLCPIEQHLFADSLHLLLLCNNGRVGPGGVFE